jgi:hypothetical protein
MEHADGPSSQASHEVNPHHRSGHGRSRRDLRARRIMLTHMNPVMLAHLDEVRAAGALVAEDGAVIDL